MGQTQKDQILALSISLMIAPVLFVSLRFKSRRLRGSGIVFEDWLLVAALVVNAANCIGLIIGSRVGILGSHEQFGPDHLPLVTPGHIVSFKIQYISQLFALFVEGSTKLSVLLLYRRIFDHRKFRMFNSVWIVIAIVWTVGYFFATIFQCTPIDTFWLSPISEAAPGKCVSYQILFLSGSITDVLVDGMILALPIPMVWNLHMPLRRRFGLMLIFLLGAFVIGIGIIRVNEFSVTTTQDEQSVDLSFIFAKAYIWTEAEMATGIICACLPTFAPLFDSSARGSIAHGFNSSVRPFLSKASGSRSRHGGGTYACHDGHMSETASANTRDDGCIAIRTRYKVDELSLEDGRRDLGSAQQGISVKMDADVDAAIS